MPDLHKDGRNILPPKKLSDMQRLLLLRMSAAINITDAEAHILANTPEKAVALQCGIQDLLQRLLKQTN